ncbi:MAG: HPP family protein [Nevskiales bacterium]
MPLPSAPAVGAREGTAWRSRALEVVLAGLGAFAALALVGLLAATTKQALMLGSFGASCVLLFGFPSSPFSPAKNVICGHLLASFIGLLFLHLFGPGWLPLAGAGACALMAMMLTRTVHPPAGSNPVIVFLAQPGWQFLLVPTLAGAVLLVLIARLYWNTVRRKAQ